MSGKVVGWAFEQSCRSPVAKLILVKLADNANEEGYCWPSVALIVKHTGLSERAVRANLGSLEEDGLIRIETRMTAHRGQISNAYQLAVSRADDASPAGGAGGRTSTVQTPPAPHAGPACTARTPIRTVNEPAVNLPTWTQTGSDAPSMKARIAALRTELGKNFDAWFQEAKFSEGSPLAILLPNSFKANWVRGHFSGAIERVLGEDVVILAADEGHHTTSNDTAQSNHGSAPNGSAGKPGQSSANWLPMRAAQSAAH